MLSILQVTALVCVTFIFVFLCDSSLHEDITHFLYIFQCFPFSFILSFSVFLSFSKSQRNTFDLYISTKIFIIFSSSTSTDSKHFILFILFFKFQSTFCNTSLSRSLNRLMSLSLSICPAFFHYFFSSINLLSLSLSISISLAISFYLIRFSSLLQLFPPHSLISILLIL